MKHSKVLEDVVETAIVAASADAAVAGLRGHSVISRVATYDIIAYAGVVSSVSVREDIAVGVCAICPHTVFTT